MLPTGKLYVATVVPDVPLSFTMSSSIEGASRPIACDLTILAPTTSQFVVPSVYSTSSEGNDSVTKWPRPPFVHGVVHLTFVPLLFTNAHKLPQLVEPEVELVV